jgi:hypothetical protein
VFYSNSGGCDCALFGSYVDELQSLLCNTGWGMPVFVIQFAKIDNFEGIYFN